MVALLALAFSLFDPAEPLLHRSFFFVFFNFLLLTRVLTRIMRPFINRLLARYAVKLLLHRGI